MKPLRAIVRKHRQAGVLVDTNLLLLLWVGTFDEQLIGRCKRLNDFKADDFRILATFVAQFDRLIATPNILTEVSNLSGCFKGETLEKFRLEVGVAMATLREKFVPSAEAASSDRYPDLGLTDTAIEHLALKGALTVTAEGPLYAHLRGRGCEVLNLADLRGRALEG